MNQVGKSVALPQKKQHINVMCYNGGMFKNCVNSYANIGCFNNSMTSYEKQWLVQDHMSLFGKCQFVQQPYDVI